MISGDGLSFKDRKDQISVLLHPEVSLWSR